MTIYPEQFPGIIVREALLAGQSAPDLGEPFSYCDLNDRSTATLGLLAASFPDASFYAIRPGMEGGENLHFVENLDAIPPCDFMSVRDCDDDTLASAAQVLKPGGLLHITADLTPGTGQTAPLRTLFAHATSHLSDDPGAALDLTARLARANTPYQRGNPQVTEALDTWSTREAAEVADELRGTAKSDAIGAILRRAEAHGLHCCGPLEHLSAKGRQLAQHFAPDVTDPAILEDYFSVLANEASRALVFIKPEGAFARNPMSLLGAHVVGFPVPTRWREAIDIKPAETLSDWTAAQDTEALCLGTGMMQVAAEVIRGDDIEYIGRVIGAALMERKAMLYAADTLHMDVTANTPIEAVHPMTTEILDTPRTYRFGAHVPSCILGGGVYLSPVHAALLRATIRGEATRILYAKELIAEMDAQAPPFALPVPPERPLPDPAEEYAQFDADWLPFLARLGVIQARQV